MIFLVYSFVKLLHTLKSIFMKILKITGKLCAITIGTFILLSLTLISCKKDDVNGGGSGSGSAPTAIKITDAPIDNASVTGAFVTIADIKLDGQSVQGFTKTTVNVAAYQNGSTTTIGNFNLEGRSYSSLTFVLDYDTDANGNSPGSYVLTTGNVKHKLQSTSNSITVTKNFTLQSNASNSIVADFDLRKMIIHQTGNPSDQYDFATAAELQSSIRVIAQNQTGTMSGTLTDNVSASGKVVAYVYKKGTYNRTVEMQEQGASGIQFKNAVNSSLVASNGTYQLHFLESGAYEVHFASYKDTNADGEYELQGTLIVIGAGSIDLLNLNITTSATLTVDATATGVLP